MAMKNNKNQGDIAVFMYESPMNPEIQDPPPSERYPGQTPRVKKPKTTKNPQIPQPDAFPERDPWRSPETDPSRHRIQEPD